MTQTQLNRIKIALRKDTISNWDAKSDQVLLDGEIAIVVDNEGNENIKIGNGISSFSQLPYIYQNSIKSEKVIANEVTAKSIAQGYNVKATPTSLATGVFTEAKGNFNIVHGIEALALSSDDYAFVYNGQNLPGIGINYYVSHGEGTFNVNPVGGLSGFYIGDESLSEKFYEKSEISSKQQLALEFAKYYTIQQTDTLYRDLQNKIKLSSESLCARISDVSVDLKAQNSVLAQAIAVNKSGISELSSSLSSYEKISDLTSNYYRKTETSSSSQIKNEIDSVSADIMQQTKSFVTTVASKIAAVDAKADVISAAIPLSVGQLLNDSGYLANENLSFNYVSSEKKIYLKGYDKNIGTVDCADFIKDGMLSSVQLCGNVLVFVFNTDAGKTPISVNLSSFVDNYDAKISYLSNAISTDVKNLADNYWKKSETSSSTQIKNEFDAYWSRTALSIYGLCSTVESTSATLNAQDVFLAQDIATLKDDVLSISSAVDIIGSDYLDSSDKIDILNKTLSPDEVKLYRGPGQKDVSLSVGTGSQLCVYTASLSDFSLTSETTKAYVGWNNNALQSVKDLSIINITRDDYYNLVDSGNLVSGAQYIISNDTYLNWPSRISIDFLSSGTKSQDDIVSCINNIISIFNHVNIDGNQLLRLVTIEKLSSEIATQDDIVDTVNSILSAYKNQLSPYTVIEKGKLDDYVKDDELSLYYISSDNTVNLDVKGNRISAQIPESAKFTIRVWND